MGFRTKTEQIQRPRCGYQQRTKSENSFYDYVKTQDSGVQNSVIALLKAAKIRFPPLEWDIRNVPCFRIKAKQLGVLGNDEISAGLLTVHGDGRISSNVDYYASDESPQTDRTTLGKYFHKQIRMRVFNGIDRFEIAKAQPPTPGLEAKYVEYQFWTGKEDEIIKILDEIKAGRWVR